MRNARLISLISASMLMLILGACTSGSPEIEESDLRIAAIHGSSIEGIEASFSGNVLEVHISKVLASGTYFEFPALAGFHVNEQIWNGDNGAIHLAIEAETGLQLGVAQTPDYSGSAISARIVLASAGKTASVPPVGSVNTIDDLTVLAEGAGTVRLEWTQINTGDYDFNGQVNISDLTPLGANFNAAYERGAAGAENTTVYWVDGDANGVINITDLTPIAQNFTSTVAGYNVKQNGTTLPGNPTVPLSSATKRPALPNIFSILLDGNTGDEWVVAPVDSDGIEGADSAGNEGPVELLAKVSITGQELLDLASGLNPGPFGNGKVGLRIIDPIDNVDSVSPGDIDGTGTAGEFEVASLPKSQLQYLQFEYIPGVDLADGSPKGLTSTKGGSAVNPDDIVVTSVPINIPAGTQLTEVNANIDISEANPDGGFYVTLGSELLLDGVPQPLQTRTVRLDYKNGFLSSDTDGNDDYSDECEIEDSDRDCVSSNRRDQEYDDELYDDNDDDRDEIEIEGIVMAFDEAAGTITLSNIVIEDGDATLQEIMEAQPLSFNEFTNFEQKIKLPDDDIEEDIDPSVIMPGDMVEIDLYRLRDGSGELTSRFWVEKIDRRIDMDPDDD